MATSSSDGIDKENILPKPSRRSTRGSLAAATSACVPPTPVGLKTPAFAKNLPCTPACPGTEGRYPRRGESLMSANGSPVGIYGGARATFGLGGGGGGGGGGGDNDLGDIAAPMISVQLHDGQEVRAAPCSRTFC